jgi:endonuclease/exonuclease/phosphatase (EEP) superfamily protein YafD
VQGGHTLSALISFTPYVVLAGVLVSGIALALRNWPAAAVALLATALLVAAVLPRALGAPATARPGEAELRLLSANVHRGTAEPQQIVGLVDELEVEVLAIQELTPEFAHALREAGLRRRLPNAVLSVDPSAAGAGIYSRLPVESLGAASEAESGFRMPRALVRARGGRPIRLVAVHPEPPTVDAASWRSGLEGLPSAGSGPPWVLAGDFNATLDHAELRDVLDRGYFDGGDATGMGLEPTWPSGRRLPPLITIDHVLADRRLDFLDFDVLDLRGSDHRAVFAVIGVP